MEDDDCDGLPMYVEEDEEEAAAEKEKRRRQSRKPPRMSVTPEELARIEFNQAVARKLYEYDPKLGTSCYTRAWFTKERTDAILLFPAQYGPMRFADSVIREDHELTESLNMLCVKILSSDVGYPISVYGTVIIKDSLDLKRNYYIFRRDRDNCQHITSPGESLILTGPSRGVVLTKSLVQRKTVDSWLSEVELVFAYVEKALEGTIKIKILSGPGSFHGKITACTTDVSSHMLLYDSGAITVSDGRVLRLLCYVVSVPLDKMLEFNIWASSSDQNATTSHRQLTFTPFMKGAETDEITCGLYNLQVKVVWSTMIK
ncbi:hypothetical protein SETIT_5G290300v2 [Setaria italica]|uniref:DUF6598 domain-containing protein n=3 Tax=Setaria italica TaxID=4555 RepID=A0A368R9V8_SETIT|nr:hypothetical protein SETIT_5G290300v2 [Setaria italica]